MRETNGARSVARPSTSVIAVELSEPLPRLEPGESSAIRCLVRLAGDPIDYVDLQGPLDSDALADALWEAAGDAISARLERDGMTPVDRLPAEGIALDPDDPRTAPVSGDELTVVIATRDRTDSLRETLRSLAEMRTAPAAVVVVDSAPSDDATRRMVEDEFAAAGVQYLRADAPGLAIAHNVALRAVDTELVAFTDDDVLADRLWASRIVRWFDDPVVGAVTGLIVPRELRTTAQHWIEDAMGLQKGFEPRRFDLAANRPDDRLFPFTAGTMGSGANMSFRRSVLLEMGGFDPALGAGRRSRGGDDLAALYDTVLAGHQVVYEPAAIVYHRHHDTTTAVRRTAYGYGVGLGAYLARAASKDRRQAVAMGAAVGQGLRALVSHRAQQDPSDDYPRAYRVLERLGVLCGPFEYARTRFEDRRTPPPSHLDETPPTP